MDAGPERPDEAARRDAPERRATLDYRPPEPRDPDRDDGFFGRNNNRRSLKLFLRELPWLPLYILGELAIYIGGGGAIFLSLRGCR
jgi:hypothetical protein